MRSWRGSRRASDCPVEQTSPVRHLGAFAWRTLKAFKANQGLLLAGAVAYYALLSIIPLVILMVIALSHFIPEVELVEATQRYLDWIVPGQGEALGDQLTLFLQHQQVVSWVLLG